MTHGDDAANASGVPEILHLSLLKAEPVLRLLVAQRGFRIERLQFEDAWNVFKTFMKLPVVGKDGGATFQAYPTDPRPDVLEVFIGRQLAGPVYDGDQFLGNDVQLIGFSYIFEPPAPSTPDIDDLDLSGEIWSPDCGSLHEFFQKVEATDAFREACNRPIMYLDFFTQEDPRSPMIRSIENDNG